MDVDALTKDKHKRSATKQDLCHHCGKPEHVKRDCKLAKAEKKNKSQPKGRGRLEARVAGKALLLSVVEMMKAMKSPRRSRMRLSRLLTSVFPLS